MNEKTVSALSQILEYGPIGLAGLMLILTILALISGSLSERKSSLLRQFMYIGASCFALALLAPLIIAPNSHTIFFRVEPIDSGSQRILPRPIISVNGAPIQNSKYTIKSDVTSIVDVTDAMKYAGDLRGRAVLMQQTLSSVPATLTPVIDDLQRIPQIIDRNCPGGSNGTSAASNPVVLAAITRTLSAISGLRSQTASTAGADIPSAP